MLVQTLNAARPAAMGSLALFLAIAPAILSLFLLPTASLFARIMKTEDEPRVRLPRTRKGSHKGSH